MRRWCSNMRTCSRRGAGVADAERRSRDLLAQDPLDANALNSLGYMLAERGERLDEAVELVQRALKVEPGNPSFLDSLGWAYYQQGKLDLADPPLTEAAAKLPAELGRSRITSAICASSSSASPTRRRRGSVRSPATASRSIAPRSRRRCATPERACSSRPGVRRAQPSHAALPAAGLLRRCRWHAACGRRSARRASDRRRHAVS